MRTYVERAADSEEAGKAFDDLLKAARDGTVSQARRTCWSCGQRMQRFGFGESPFMILDRCAEHGLWLDRSELKKVVRASRAHAAALGWMDPFDDDD